jgi:hypothetical protein
MVIVAASADDGKLPDRSRISADVSRQIRRLSDDEMQRLNLALAFALGLSD